jgi:type IV pilus assembly protein PilW
VTPPGTTNNPCSTNVVAHWKTSLSIHVAGLNNAPATTLAPWDCVAPKEDTDVIFIQRASTCAVGEAGCEAENGDNAYLQVTDCGEEYSALMPNPFVVAVGGSPAGTFNMQNKECDGATFAPKRKVIRRIYYVSADEVLSYIDIRADGVQDPVQLAENIEQMQIEYGIASADSAGTPVIFTATPETSNACGSPAPGCVPFIVGARVWLLARSTVASRNTKNAVTFEMSDKTVDIPAASSNQKRRVYNTYIPFVTPKSRREAS